MSDLIADIPRVCLVCEHFSIDAGEQGYSELTPGREGSIDCDVAGKKGCAWPRDDRYPDVTPMALRSIAEACRLFEVHRDLKPKESVP